MGDDWRESKEESESIPSLIGLENDFLSSFSLAISVFSSSQSSKFKSLSTLSTSFNLKPTSRSFFSTLSPSVKPSTTPTRYQTLSQIHQTSFRFRKMSISSKAAPEPTLFIDGKWCHSSDGASREVIDVSLLGLPS